MTHWAGSILSYVIQSLLVWEGQGQETSDKDISGQEPCMRL